MYILSRVCAQVCSSSSPSCWEREGHVLVLMDEERVVLVVVDYVRYGGKCEVANCVLAIRCRVNIEMLTTV